MVNTFRTGFKVKASRIWYLAVPFKVCQVVSDEWYKEYMSFPLENTKRKIQKHKVDKNTPRFQPIDPTGKYKKEESKYMKSTIILPGSNRTTHTGRGNWCSSSRANQATATVSLFMMHRFEYKYKYKYNIYKYQKITNAENKLTNIAPKQQANCPKWHGHKFVLLWNAYTPLRGRLNSCRCVTF